MSLAFVVETAESLEGAGLARVEIRGVGPPAAGGHALVA
jgi:hypothetical protein